MYAANTGPHLTTEDIEIQYGYTGTRSHGMVIDFTSGDYSNIRIENVESWHGEANGMTIYKESYVNLAQIVVRNVSAGTRLNQQIVDGLPALPNLVPRACPVDIHQDTVIDYLNGEAVDNIIFENVNGFENCDQFGQTNEMRVGKGAASIEFNPIISIICFLFSVSMTMISMYALYQSVCTHEKKDVNSEQTPLLTHV